MEEKPIEERELVVQEEKINKFENLSSLEQQLNYAQILINSKALPKQYLSAESVLMVINYGKELGFPPITSLMNIYYVNGRPSLATQAIVALANKNGIAHKTIEDWIPVKNEEGKPYKDVDGLVCRRTTIRYYRKHPTLGIILEEDFSFSNWEAKTAGIYKNVWISYEKVMLWYRTYALGLRRFAPDVLSGLYSVDEMIDSNKNLSIDYILDEENNIKIIDKNS